MMFLVPMLCLCAASALGAAVDTEAIKASEVVKSAEMPVKMIEPLLKKDELPLRKDEALMLMKKGEPILKEAVTMINKDEPFMKKAEMMINKDEPFLKKAEMMIKKDEFALKKDAEALIKPVETDDKFVDLIANVNEANPWKKVAGGNVLFTNLLVHNFPIKTEIKSAYNLKDELENYKKMGFPDVLPFTNDNGEIVYGVMTENAAVPIISIHGIDLNKGVKFHFFNKFDEEDMLGEEITDFGKLRELGWDDNKPVKVIVHGFINTIKSPVIQTIKNAYLKTGQFNVIGVDWGKLAATNVLWYPWARDNVPAVGARIGAFLDALVDGKATEARKLHLIGHSLGAHVAGIAGKSMAIKPARITGLDPAKPFFELTAEAGRLTKDDAELVDVIHTNAGYLGRTDLNGHVDFFPNGGIWQVGCRTDVWGACSHGRSYELFAKTILTGQGLDGVLCKGLPGLSTGRKCLSRMASKEPITTALMGDGVRFREGGAYFVDYDLAKLLA